MTASSSCSSGWPRRAAAWRRSTSASPRRRSPTSCATRWSALLFAGDDQFDVAERIAAESETPVRLIALTGEREGWERFDDWYGAYPAIDPALGEGDDDDVLQLYTSGTTGHPKGVVLSNRNYRRFLETSSGVDGFDYQSDQTLMIVMPLFHVAGVNVSCAGLAHGCRTIIVRDFVPARALEIMQDEAVAHTFIAPAMILMLLQSPAITETDFGALRTIAYGASPISEEVLNRAGTPRLAASCSTMA